MSNVKIAKPLYCNVQGSFAWKTAQERWPKIVTKVVDQLHRNFYPFSREKGEDCGKEITEIIGKISEMRYRIETNKPLVDFFGKAPWILKWNVELEKLRKEMGGEDKVTWYDAPWLFVECYLYSKINEFVTSTVLMKDYDVHYLEKQSSYRDSEKMIGTLLNELAHWEGDQNVDKRMVLKRLIQITLWGNKADLSLSCGNPHDIEDNLFESLEKLESSILCNDVEKAIDRILGNQKDKDFHIVFDNAGLELVTDLALAEFLIDQKLTRKVVFHGKEFPWFVSDVTENDYKWVLNTMENSQEAVIRNYGKKWRKRKEFELRCEPFWTTWHPFCHMKNEDPNLFKQLEDAELVLFKGDLCYRKLVSDLDWPHNTDFKVALQSFSTVPLLALRTLKAETVVGLPKEALDFIKKKYGNKDLSWMTSSDFALAQINFP